MPSSPPDPQPAVPDASAEPASPARSRRAIALAWLKEIAITAAIAGGVLFVIGVLRGPGGGTNVAVADVAPGFALARADGRGEVTSQALRGKPTVLTFWATWCPSCRDEMPELEALHRQAGDAINVVVVSQEPPQKLLGFAKRQALTLPMYSDSAVFTAFGIDMLPTTIIIDAEGRVIAELSGTKDADELEALARGED